MVYKDGSKSGGKVKGTVHRLTSEYREIIETSNPLLFLIDAFKSGYVDGEKLSARERCDIARDLVKKIVPDLKSVEVKNKDTERLIFTILDYRAELGRQHSNPQGLPPPTLST
jgi:hypothetical protein